MFPLLLGSSRSLSILHSWSLLLSTPSLSGTIGSVLPDARSEHFFTPNKSNTLRPRKCQPRRNRITGQKLLHTRPGHRERKQLLLLLKTSRLPSVPSSFAQHSPTTVAAPTFCLLFSRCSLPSSIQSVRCLFFVIRCLRQPEVLLESASESVSLPDLQIVLPSCFATHSPHFAGRMND